MTAPARHLQKAAKFHLPSRSGRRAFGGISRLAILTSVVFVSLVAGAGMGMGQAAAAPSNSSGVLLNLYGSSSTNVGLQVFAVVSLGGAANPTGTVTFRLFGPSDPNCSSSPLLTSTVAIASSSPTSDRYTTTVAGTYQWEVSYSGDAHNNPAGPTPCATPSGAVIVTKAWTNLNVTAAQPSGGTIRASAALGGYNPTGTVTFYLTPPGDAFCSTTPVFTSTVNVNGNGSYWSAPYPPTLGGQYKWRATYSGDANNNMVPVSACLDQNAAVAVAAATFTFPFEGATNVDPTLPFAWLGVPSAQGYRLTVGTTATGSDLVASGTLPTTQTSYLVPPLPTGRTLYAAVYTELNGSWASYQSISFTAQSGRATFTYPLDGQTNVDTSQAFSWAAIPRAQGYFLEVGTSCGGYDLVWSGILPASQSTYKVTSLPAGPVCAVLYTEADNIWYSYQIINFSAIPLEAGLISPTNGQANVAPNTTFDWTTVAGVSGVQGYALWISSVYGGANLYNSGILPPSQSSVTPPAMPSGQTLYVLLLTERNGVWSNQSIYITTGGPTTARASSRAPSVSSAPPLMADPG